MRITTECYCCGNEIGNDIETLYDMPKTLFIWEPGPLHVAGKRCWETVHESTEHVFIRTDVISSNRHTVLFPTDNQSGGSEILKVRSRIHYLLIILHKPD
ncbi:Berberine bridge enzyme-like 13 [Fusarium oxysporum f. sp. albedinis]|nr:Berberine bridge enzyme-like 13 [Fusarium oxysporum f. sp. albedinis]